MPTAPAKPCPVPTCPERVPCPVHASALAQHARGDRFARTPWQAWYHLARWRHPVWGLRARALRRDPLCVECVKVGLVEPSIDVDHVIPHRGDPALFWNLSNLAGLCKRHHAIKTGRGL